MRGKNQPAQLKAVFAKSAVHHVDEPSTTTLSPITSRFAIRERLSQHTARTKSEHEERERQNRQKKEIHEKAKQKKIQALKEQQETIKVEIQTLKDLQKGNISPDEIKKLTEEQKKVLPNLESKGDAELAKLKKAQQQKKRDIEKFTNPTPIEPSGTQHARRNPFTGAVEHGRLRTELIKDPNFIGFVNGEPVFRPPETVPEGPRVTSTAEMSEKEMEKNTEDEQDKFKRFRGSRLLEDNE